MILAIATGFSVLPFSSDPAHALGRLCKHQSNFAFALHGGAVWGSAKHPDKEAFLLDQLVTGRERLTRGDKALNVVEDSVAAMENSGLFNAGKGSVANSIGEIEMDASIMEGKHLRAGAVASIQAVKNPVSAARVVMDDTPHVMMVGESADDYLINHGVHPVAPSYFLNSDQNFSDVSLPKDVQIIPATVKTAGEIAQFSGVWGGVLGGRLNHIVIVEQIDRNGGQLIVALGANEGLGLSKPITVRVRAKFLNEYLIAETDDFRLSYHIQPSDGLEVRLSVSDGGRVSGLLKNRPSLLKSTGTVGAVALDKCGDLAAATSTGGFGAKLPGRVGDSPIIGAGTYADNRSVAVSATGHGEYFIRHAVAHEIAARIRHGGESLVQAAYRVIFKELKPRGGEGGVIAIDKTGEVIMLFNTDGMVRGSTTDKLSPAAETFYSD